jgi:hypothetical protein
MENKILGILKEGKKSTSEISSRIKRNHWDTLEILERLSKEKKINEIKENNYVYWELK